jgi:carbamoylphosphate synthase large subunit
VTDDQIGTLVGATSLEIRAKRKEYGVLPVVKQIDTTGAETPAATNYLYVTYHGSESDVTFDDHGIMVMGSGAYRIGSSVEFDWCSVSCIRTLRKLGYKSVMVNYNPETVSTDYDECDKLYFDELSLERVLDIYELEGCASAIVSVGGQIPNGLALPLEANGVNVIGTTPTMIDCAEDRNKFSDLMDSAGIDQPKWASLTSQDAAFNFADAVGYPVLVRPSYVLSGAAMNVAYTPGELNSIVQVSPDIDFHMGSHTKCTCVGAVDIDFCTVMQTAAAVSSEYPIVISEFVEGAREIDVDAVASKGSVIAHSIAEHVENAGVHSGDATLVLPTQTISASDLLKCKDTIAKVAEALNISGPFNMQLLAKDGQIKIIECNLRASRSCPFSSKSIGAWAFPIVVPRHCSL